MTPRDPRDLAELLLKKAREDATGLRKLAEDSDVVSRIPGFLAQQAIEKCLKSVLALQDARSGTHDLAALIDQLTDAGVSVPEWMEDARYLTPFARALRYVELADDEALDSSEAVKLVDKALTWAEDYLAQFPS
jgi:HEPN domain-containing protein